MTLGPEDKFGIKIQSRGRSRTLEQNYAFLAGGIYVGIGVIGFFFTGFGNFTEATNVPLLGLFLINPFHNVVHLAVGLVWLGAAFTLTPIGTEGVNLAIGGFYLLAAVLGFLGYLSLVSVPGGFDMDFWLHLFSGLITLVVGGGLLSAMRSRNRDSINA